MVGATEAPPRSPIRIGASACLLGERVRYDGGHKRDAFLVETFGRFVEWVPVCPEVEMGLPVPRETLRLVRDRGGELHLVMPKTGADYTAPMRKFAAARLAALRREDLSGYVLKKNSPSCGLERVKVYTDYGKTGAPAATGRGLFADALRQAFPHLPIEEEGRLSDPRLRENFVERVFAYRRLRTMFSGRWALRDLVTFHTAHKLQLLAHAPRGYERLGRLVARGKAKPREALRIEYEAGFMDTLAVLATPRRHTNVLQHIVGFFKDGLDRASRHEVLELIDDYRRGLVPLIVPLTIVRHHVARLDIAYLRGQCYLDPHPKELMLRNHV
jgi:uncharacterized protein YbgA (DUF1722 family)/uncharacterized protein YbbK (DUF523 family)